MSICLSAIKKESVLEASLRRLYKFSTYINFPVNSSAFPSTLDKSPILAEDLKALNKHHRDCLFSRSVSTKRNFLTRLQNKKKEIFYSFVKGIIPFTANLFSVSLRVAHSTPKTVWKWFGYLLHKVIHNSEMFVRDCFGCVDPYIEICIVSFGQEKIEGFML